MNSSVSPVRPSRHAPPRSKRTSTRCSTRSPSPLQRSNVMVVPPSVPKKSEPNGKPAARRRTPVNKRVATNGPAAMANGHDASVTVQLQDIQEQQDPSVVVDEECASRPNGHTDPKTAVVPQVADNKGDGAAKKIDWEIPRKTLHSSIGFATIALYLGHYTVPPVIYGLLVALALISTGDFLRFNNKPFAELYEKVVGAFMRESEKTKVNGTVWYIIGVTFCLAFYPMDVAVVSIITLSWADTAASTIGRLWGRYTPALPRRIPYIRISYAPRKSTAGFIAAFITGGLIASGFWVSQTPSTVPQAFAVPPIEATKSWNWDQRVGGGWAGLGMLGIWAGIVTAVSESMDLGNLDDNLTLPIMAGAGIWAYLSFLRLIDTGLRSIPQL